MPVFLHPRLECIWPRVGKNRAQRDERTQNGKEHENNELGENILRCTEQSKEKKRSVPCLCVSQLIPEIVLLDSYHITAWKWSIISISSRKPLCCSRGLVNSLLGSPASISYQFETEKPSVLNGVISLEMVAILKSSSSGLDNHRRILLNPLF